MQPHLVIIALSLWLIVFLGLTCVVFALISMWKEDKVVLERDAFSSDPGFHPEEEPAEDGRSVGATRSLDPLPLTRKALTF